MSSKEGICCEIPTRENLIKGAGWKKIVFSTDIILVYTLAPLVGGLLASLFFVKIIEPCKITEINNLTI